MNVRPSRTKTILLNLLGLSVSIGLSVLVAEAISRPIEVTDSTHFWRRLRGSGQIVAAEAGSFLYAETLRCSALS
jgi:hypothetical protein